MRRMDVVVVGAGPAGLCFARALAGSGLQVGLVDVQPRQALAEAAFDGREIALTHASRQSMEQLGLWQRLPHAEVAELRDARVMNGGSPFALTFASSQVDGQPLGWLVPNHLIRRAAWDAVQGQDRLELFDGRKVLGVQADAQGHVVKLDDGSQLHARLLVAADSRFSATRRMLGIGAQMRDFGKSMLVCRMQVERDHHHTAWEWFGYGRTMALLPLNEGQASAVITLPPRQIEELLAMDEVAFGEAVSACFEHRLGRMQPVATPQAYPLVGCTPTASSASVQRWSAMPRWACTRSLHMASTWAWPARSGWRRASSRSSDAVPISPPRACWPATSAVIGWRRGRCTRPPTRSPACTPTTAARRACCGRPVCVWRRAWLRSGS